MNSRLKNCLQSIPRIASYNKFVTKIKGKDGPSRENMKCFPIHSDLPLSLTHFIDYMTDRIVPVVDFFVTNVKFILLYTS